MSDFNEYNDPTPVATVEQYKKAFIAVRDRFGISQKQLTLLRAQLKDDRKVIAADPFSKESGINVNSEYGGLAHHITEAIPITLRPTRDGQPHWWRALSFGPHEPDNTAAYYWIMRPEVVQALTELRW